MTRRPETEPPEGGDPTDNGGGEAPRAGSESPLVQQALTAAQQGNSEALHFLYVRYAPDVFRYPADFVNEDHEVEEIIEGVFANLGTTINDHEQRGESFAAWILRVARNAALDQ